MYSDEQIKQWKLKAEKFDQLEEKIAACYGKENEEGEWIENDDEDTDLFTIGEIAASFFGWI